MVLETQDTTHPGIDVDLSVLGTAETIARLSLGSLGIGLAATPPACAARCSDHALAQ